MNTTRQASWLFVLLLCLACSSWYYASSSDDAPKLDDKALAKTIDTTITQLTVRQYDKAGKLANYLHTPTLHHIPTNNTHWLETPHIIVQQDKQPPWEIRAQQATSLYGGDKIIFNQNVVIQQIMKDHKQESMLKTDELTYFPKDKLAETNKNVVYEQPGSVIQSTGMKAYLAEKRVQLLTKARGTYDPTHG